MSVKKLFLLSIISCIIALALNLKSTVQPIQPVNHQNKVAGKELTMALPSGSYVGNQDFRGYVAQNAPSLLGYVGNDGGFNYAKYVQNNAGQPGLKDSAASSIGTVNGLYNAYNKLNAGSVQPAPSAPRSNTTGTVSSSLSVANPNQQSIDLINAAVGRLPGELQTAQGNIQGEFNQNLNELNSGEQAAHGQYNQSTAQNQQQFVTNKNQINSQASSGLNSLLRVLGQHGAGGSSAALYAAPNAVGDTAALQRAGAGQTFGQNQQGLDSSWNNYENGVQSSHQKLNDWLTQQQNQAQVSSEQSRQGLLQQLAGLQGSVAAAQPYIDQINQSAQRADSLGALHPTYTGSTPSYTAPSVGSYTVNQVGAPQVQGSSFGSAATPALSFLLGKKDNTNVPAF